MVSGSPGLNSRSTAPVCSDTNRTSSQFSPPSFVRYTPRSGFRREGVADLGDPDPVRVVRMDQDGARTAGFLEPQVPPGLAGVVGPVNALPDDDVAAQAVRTGGHVNDVRVALGHRDAPDRGALEVAVGNGMPVVSVVGGLPDPAAGGAHVERPGLGAMSRDRGDPAAAGGPDHAVAHGVQHVGIGLGGRGRGHQRRSERRKEEGRKSPAHRTCLRKVRDRNGSGGQTPLPRGTRDFTGAGGGSGPRCFASRMRPAGALPDSWAVLSRWGRSPHRPACRRGAVRPAPARPGGEPAGRRRLAAVEGTRRGRIGRAPAASGDVHAPPAPRGARGRCGRDAATWRGPGAGPGPTGARLAGGLPRSSTPRTGRRPADRALPR